MSLHPMKSEFIIYGAKCCQNTALYNLKPLYELQTRVRIHNTAFSSQLTNSPNKLECCISQGLKG
jgi:hypothetical protein